ncbi:transporter substrate-binding domain-containing protein [Pantoea sp. Taur]|nr:transporter substrate-binding domain-containing protein [Pantoea sp. Taur]
MALGILLLSYPLAAEEYQLLTRAPTDELHPLVFTPSEQAWINHKHNLVMGIFRYDSPPFGMRNIRQEYEGLSADYAALMQHQLGLPVSVRMFDTPDEAWTALSRGEIDFIPSVNAFRDDGNFVLTQPYASEKPVLGIEMSHTEPLPQNLENTTVAMVRDYLPLEEVRRYYPYAQLRLYDNYQDALSAVSFGHASVFLGNSYALNRNFLNDLRIARFSQMPAKEVGFALSKRDPELLGLLNKALASIPESENLELLRQWQPNTTSLDQWTGKLDFTPAERAWMKTHPAVNVVLYSGDKAAPISFIDGNGTLRGMVGDLLSVVAIKTGLRFTFSTVDTTSELLRKVNTTEADMFASLTPSPQRALEILFTRPYLRSAFALTVRSNNNDIHSLPDLRGQTLAMVKNTGVEAMVRARFPEITILPVENEKDLMQSVLDGNATAAVSILTMADYQIKTHYATRLKIVATVGEQPAWISFGVGKADPELRGILDKVLISIPPIEIENMANRWRPSDLVVVDNVWVRFRPIVMVSALSAGVILLLLAGWTWYLRREIRRKAALRRQLNDQLAQMRTLVTSMPFPVSLRDNQGRLTYCNQRYLIETGVKYDEALGKTMVEHPGLRTPEQAAFYHRQMMEVIATDKAILEDRRYDLWDNPNSSIGITVYQWIQPYHNSEGKVIGVIGGWMDISEREALFAELREARQRAEDSNRAKSVFLSTMSHEIRTPMNAIIGMLDMALKKGRQGQHDLQALDVAYESAESLVGLIGDILDLSRIEGGHLEYHPEPVQPGKLIDNLMKVFQGLALDKNISLSKQFPDEPVMQVMADPLRIKQVLSNLLSNAIKFTDQGGVMLSLQQHWDETDDVVHFRIEVRDSGIGIDTTQQAALFRPFSQAENRRSGTGLGLYISRSICENMGGSLTLESEKGQGTCATATFALPRVNGTQESKDDALIQDEKLPVMRVLVVDDNAANRMLLARQLSWLGQEVELAEEGYQALSLWQQQPFDIIITDCNMPGLSGYQLTQILRESEEEQGRKAAWIIGFTANAMHEVMERCLAAGMNSCLFKPCSITSLAQALREAQPEGTLPAVTAPEVNDDVDRQMETAMLQLMITTLDEDLLRMHQLHLPEHRIQIAELAHRMAGSVRIARQNALADACLALEKQCREDAVLQGDFSALLTRLERYAEQLKQVETLGEIKDA